MKKSIQITLDINGDYNYIMKYPETVNLTLELSRSEVWWGVFLSVIESFQAIKEDREYLKEAFEKWEISGYSPEFNLNITIAVLEFDEYKTIYTGAALPEYTDDTLYFKTKFTEVSNVQKFLDRSIERVFNMAEDRETFTFDTGFYDGLQGVFDVMNALQSTERIYINTLSLFVEIGSDQRVVNFSDSDQTLSIQSSFASGGNDVNFNYIGNKNVPKSKDYFFVDNDIALPKQAEANINLITRRIIPYARDNSNNYQAPDNFLLEFAINNNLAEDDVIEFEKQEQQGLSDATGFGLPFDVPEVTISNTSGNNAFLRMRTNFDRINEYDNFVISYPYVLAELPVEGQQTLSIEYETLNHSIDTLTIEKILDDLFDVDIEFWLLNQNFYDYAFLPYDGAIAGTSTSTITINIADFLQEISKALSIGVTVNLDDKKLLIKPIWEMFSDEELFILEDDVISSFEISLNEFLKVGKLTLGAADRNFNYSYDKIGQNRQTVYNARNSFSGSLDLSLTTYKAQMYDFVDSYRDDVFDLYEEDKNDLDFTLFQKTRIFNTDGYYQPGVRFNNINSGHTAVSQVACWSWLLQTISPNGFDSQSEDNLVVTYSPVSASGIDLINDIDSSWDAFTELPQKITLRKFNATIKLTTEQYNRIVNNRDGYLTLIYKGVTYKGYINNLSLQIGKNMIASVELLERFEQ